jgi:hypothetical protein
MQASLKKEELDEPYFGKLPLDTKPKANQSPALAGEGKYSLILDHDGRYAVRHQLDVVV